MRNQRWTKSFGVVVMLAAAAAGVALFLRPTTARTSTNVTPAVADLTSADGGAAALGAPAGPPGQTCKPKETGTDEAKRVVPLVVATMDFTEAEKKGVLDVMVKRNTDMESLPRVRREDIVDGGAGNPTLERGKAIDKESRESLSALLGKERGRKFYDSYHKLAHPERRAMPGAPGGNQLSSAPPSPPPQQ